MTLMLRHCNGTSPATRVFVQQCVRANIKETSNVRATGPCITNVFATRRKNFSQWYRSFQRKLLSHWRHVAITLVIQGPGPLWGESNGDRIPSQMRKAFPFNDVFMRLPYHSACEATMMIISPTCYRQWYGQTKHNKICAYLREHTEHEMTTSTNLSQDTKLLPICRRYFQMCFLERKRTDFA